jgi:HSP20 family protein
MRDVHRILLSSEVRDLTDEVERLFDDLDRHADGVRRSAAGHCVPALDIQDTADSVEVIVDLPGTGPETIRILLKNGVLVIAGDKPSPHGPDREEGSFHLVERGFGRFARAVRLEGAFDGAKTRAVLDRGALHVTVPKLEERRGREMLIPVTTA